MFLNQDKIAEKFMSRVKPTINALFASKLANLMRKSMNLDLI